jgi:flagellar biosynthesis protein FlhG
MAMAENNDQAASLRKHAASMNGKIQLQSKKAVCCISIASGKGGVGKTFFTVNLAVAFSKLNKKVLLVDADLGLANADIALGVTPEFSLQDAIFKGKDLHEVAVKTDYGVDLLAASSGSKEIISMGAARMGMFIKELISFASEYDVLLFDCAAGIDSNVTSFISATPQSIIIATAQPTSVMDVYALMKIIHQDNLSENVGLVVNMVDSENQGQKVADTLSTVSQRYLTKSMDLLGILPNSLNVTKALHMRKPLLSAYENDDVSERIRRIARTILQKHGGMTKLENLNADKLISGLMMNQ